MTKTNRARWALTLAAVAVCLLVAASFARDSESSQADRDNTKEQYLAVIEQRSPQPVVADHFASLCLIVGAAAAACSSIIVATVGEHEYVPAKSTAEGWGGL